MHNREKVQRLLLRSLQKQQMDETSWMSILNHWSELTDEVILDLNEHVEGDGQGWTLEHVVVEFVERYRWPGGDDACTKVRGRFLFAAPFLAHLDREES